MANLGTFRKDKTVEPEDFNTFDLEGVEIRVKHKYNQLEFLDTMRKLKKVDEEDPDALDLAFHSFTMFLHPNDVDLFIETCIANDYDMPDVTTLLESVLGALTDRPTGKPGDLSAGQTLTGESSQEDSSSPVSLGRPDLQLIKQQGTTKDILAA